MHIQYHSDKQRILVCSHRSHHNIDYHSPYFNQYLKIKPCVSYITLTNKGSYLGCSYRSHHNIDYIPPFIHQYLKINHAYIIHHTDKQRILECSHRSHHIADYIPPFIHQYLKINHAYIIHHTDTKDPRVFSQIPSYCRLHSSFHSSISKNKPCIYNTSH